MDLSEVKAAIRAMLLSTQSGSLPVSQLAREYHKLRGTPLDYPRLGFTSVLALLQAMPDAVHLSAGGAMAHGISTVNSNHIENLIKNQRSRPSSGRSSRGRRPVLMPPMLLPQPMAGRRRAPPTARDSDHYRRTSGPFRPSESSAAAASFSRSMHQALNHSQAAGAPRPERRSEPAASTRLQPPRPRPQPQPQQPLPQPQQPPPQPQQPPPQPQQPPPPRPRTELADLAAPDAAVRAVLAAFLRDRPQGVNREATWRAVARALSPLEPRRVPASLIVRAQRDWTDLFTCMPGWPDMRYLPAPRLIMSPELLADEPGPGGIAGIDDGEFPASAATLLLDMTAGPSGFGPALADFSLQVFGRPQVG